MKCKLCYCDTPLLHTCSICYTMVCDECYEKIPVLDSVEGTIISRDVSVCVNCKTQAENELAHEAATEENKDASKELAKDLGAEMSDAELLASELTEMEDSLRDTCLTLEEIFHYDSIRYLRIICTKLQRATEMVTENLNISYEFPPFDPLPPDDEEELKLISNDPERWEEYMDSIDDAAATLDEISGKAMFSIQQLRNMGFIAAANALLNIDADMDTVKHKLLSDVIYLKIAESAA